MSRGPRPPWLTACRFCALPFTTASHSDYHCSAECRLLSIAEPFAHIERECWVWPRALSDKGYGQISQEGAHRVAWRAFYGTIPDGLHVLHECDNPPCFNPLHLFLGTHTDNMQDMSFKLRYPLRKETQRKYSDELVATMLADPRPNRVVAEAHGVPYRAWCALKYKASLRPWLKAPAR